MQKVKEFLTKFIDKLKKLDKSKKIAICIGIVAIVAAIIFGLSYAEKNKYGILYSGLDSTDAATVTKLLEDSGVEIKIEGDTIFVPKDQVDKLRIELSSSITNGSKGFELMDEGSSLSMTDEEFKIKKVRMLQGELEKTIKTFPQVNDARVHITQGQESVFSNESTEGKAAVYVSLKPGQELDQGQIKSIMALVSASTTNIPKKNVEVIDQNMNLLSEAIYDEKGNEINGVSASASRNSEKQMSEELQNSILSMLEGIFGRGKVKVTVNAVLNYDTVQKNEVVINPDTVIKSQSKSENTSTNSENSGSPVDNNMTNNSANTGGVGSSSREENTEYEVGKTETTTLTTPGEIKKITAAVAIDGTLSDDVMYNVEKMVSSALGIDADRGDQLTVVDMPFNTDGQDIFEDSEDGTNGTNGTVKSFVGYGIIAGIIALVFAVAMIIFLKKKKAKEDMEVVEEDQNDLIAKLVKEKEARIEQEIAMEESELSLEDEIKIIVSKNTDEAIELIKTWLNE